MRFFPRPDAPAAPGRRQILAAGAAAVLVPGRAARQSPRPIRNAIQALFDDLPAAQSLGRLYLAQNRDPAPLLRPAPGSEPAGAIRARVARCRARDFAAGDTAVLDGWIFSRTEARLLALAALS